MADESSPGGTSSGSDAGTTLPAPTPSGDQQPGTQASEPATAPHPPAPAENAGQWANFRTDPVNKGRAASAEKTPDAIHNEEPEDALSEDLLRDLRASINQKPRPSRIEDAIESEIPIPRLRTSLYRLAEEKVKQQDIRPFAVFASTIVGPSLAIAAAICNSKPIHYVRLSSDTFESGTDAGQLTTIIREAQTSSPGSHVIIDARQTAQHPPFWVINKNLSAGRAACEAAGIRALVIVRNEDFRRETSREGMEEWRVQALPLQQIERPIVVTLAEEEDDRLHRDAEKSSLERRLDVHERHVQELWDALAGDELSAFVDELGKGYEASRAGLREDLFRHAVINPETRNPAQAAAIFLGSFLPDLKKDTFLELHQHLHLVAGSNWRPRKKDKKGEIERWDTSPTDFDRERAGVTFENSGTDPMLRARIGGAAAIQQFRGMFIKTGADTLRLFIEDGLATFPLLAADDEKAVAGLVSLTDEKLRREHLSPLLVDEVRTEVLSLALTRVPQLLNTAETGKVVSAVATYLSELAERLPLASSSNGDTADGATSALKLLLEDTLEIARNSELAEESADWLHDVIARTAFIYPTLRWRMVFRDIYETSARIRQRTLLTNRFWLIAINAIRHRPDLLRNAMREAAKLLTESDAGGWVHTFRIQVFSRLLTIWLFSAAAAMSGKSSQEAVSTDGASSLFDDGFIPDLSGALLAPAFNTTHRRLVEIELDVVSRTSGSADDAHVLERINHLVQIVRIIRSTCLAVLQIFLPLNHLGKEERVFLDQFALIIDKLGTDHSEARRGSFFARYRWAPAEVTSGEERTSLSSFEEAVCQWLAAIPLAVIIAERNLSASRRPLSSLLPLAQISKEPLLQLGQQIDAMRTYLQYAHEALKSFGDRETRKQAEAFLIDRRSELDKLRAELLLLIKGLPKPDDRRN
jgi:hypothetical protein